MQMSMPTPLHPFNLGIYFDLLFGFNVEMQNFPLEHSSHWSHYPYLTLCLPPSRCRSDEGRVIPKLTLFHTSAKAEVHLWVCQHFLSNFIHQKVDLDWRKARKEVPAASNEKAGRKLAGAAVRTLEASSDSSYKQMYRGSISSVSVLKERIWIH